MVSDNVNTFDGTFSTSYDLGSVSTISGLTYDLKLNYSPVITSGGIPSITSGIPYGEGWSVNVPSITVSNDVIRLTNNHCGDKPYQDMGLDYSKEGDMLWYDPTINIPGVVNGRAVFKYYEHNVAVFVLHKFEQYIEVHFDGSGWKVILPDGTVYVFNGPVMSNVNKPNNDRTSNYNLLESSIPTTQTTDIPLAAENAASFLPKKFSFKWNCSTIYHPNYPTQKIIFNYKTFGEFNFLVLS